MQKISVVIITLNEERNIERCLQSVLKVADEILVLDSFSTDRTQEICQSHQVKFIQSEWKGYSETKNYANGLAENDWILSLDADEELSDELIRSVLQLKENNDLKNAQISRLTNYCGSWIRHGAWYPDYKIRLFNRQQSSWQGHIHETLSNIDMQNLILLRGDCFHYSYYTVEDHLRQTEKFSRMSAENVFHSKKNVSLVKKLFGPSFRFIRDYIFKLGILDGKAGFTIAKISAKAVKLKYQYLKELQNG